MGLVMRALALEPHYRISRNTPRFQANPQQRFYQALQGPSWLEEAQFKQFVQQCLKHPHLGEVPEDLKRYFQSSDAAHNTFDAIAGALSIAGPQLGPHLANVVSQQYAPLQLSYIDSGQDGDVYKVQLHSKAFALKVFKAKGDVLSEFRALTFFQAHGAKDSLKTYMCGFGEGKQWMLSEFIPSEPPFTKAQWRQRGHSDMATIAQQHSILIGYTHDRVNTVLVDAGYIRKFNPAYDEPQRFDDGISWCRMRLKLTLDTAK